MRISARRGASRRLRLLSLAMLLLMPITLPHCSRAAEVAEKAMTSRLAGISLPQGAERIQNATTVQQCIAPLSTIAAQQNASLQMQSSEVLGWGGGNGYERARGRKIMAEVQAALQKVGLPLQRVGEPQSVQNGATLSFFVAGSAQKKKALVGYWLESDQLLLLVWGQFGTTGSVNGSPDTASSATTSGDTGGKHGPDSAAKAPSSSLKFPRLAARPNQATGCVLNRRGEPLASARIRFWRVTPSGAILEYVARTNQQGVYSINLPPSDQYHIDNAIALVTYREQRYYLPLRPEGEDGSFFDREAIDIRKGYIKNFVLPVSGYISPEEDPKEELSYYGGSIRFRANLKIVIPNDPDPALTAGATRPHAVPEGTRIELTLTPQGPLLDGTPGRPLHWTLQAKNTGSNAYSTTIKDIPLGTYTATALVHN